MAQPLLGYVSGVGATADQGAEHHRPPERGINQKSPEELHVGNVLITSSSGGTTYFNTRTREPPYLREKEWYQLRTA